MRDAHVCSFSRCSKTNMANTNKSSDFLSKCSFCDSDFRAEDLTLLSENEQKTTWHVTCSKCFSSAIFILSSNPSGVIGLGVITDLDKNEVKEKFLKRAVNADEVIDMHQLVSSGNFIELIKSNNN